MRENIWAMHLQRTGDTVMIRISARGAYLILGGRVGALIREGRLFGRGRLFKFLTNTAF